MIGYPCGHHHGVPQGCSILAGMASVLGVFEPVTAILVGTLVFGEAT